MAFKVLTCVAFLCAWTFVTADDHELDALHLKSCDSVTLTDAATDEAAAVIELYRFFESRSLNEIMERRAAGLPARRYGEGYVLTMIAPDEPDDPTVLWRQAPVLMHRIFDSEVGDDTTEAGWLWWDGRHDLLWVANVMSGRDQSVAAVYALPMVRADENGAISLAEHKADRKWRKTIPHPHGEPDRIAGATFGPDGKDDVVITFTRQDEAAEPARYTIDRSRMRETQRRPVDDIAEAVRLKLTEQCAADRQSIETNEPNGPITE